MAHNKKSVLLYCDLIHTVEKLSNEQAGELFKHYLRYINDLDPKTDNQLIDLVFEPIKQNLKRDLKKWRDETNKRSEAGKKGMAKRWNKDKSVKSVITKDKSVINGITKITDNVTVTDTVNVKVKEIINYLNNKCSKNFKNIEPTKKKIQARLNEKYTIDDFKKVIDTKYQEWGGTEMSKYLRPDTLFGTKFDIYLNQENVVTKKTLEKEFLEIGYNAFKRKYGLQKAIDIGDLIESK